MKALEILEILEILEMFQSMLTDSQVRSPQPIVFIQPSATTPNCLDGRDRAAEKLTGLQTNHFGAFYLPAWRMNDWMWGRLDASYRLVPMLCADDTSSASRADRDSVTVQAARPVQTAIVADELPVIGKARAGQKKLGAATSQAGQAFLDFWSAVDPTDDSALVEAFRRCTVGTELLRGQYGSPHFAAVATRSAVALGVVGTVKRISILRPALAVARWWLRLAYRFVHVAATVRRRR